jgi:hypothetical protein
MKLTTERKKYKPQDPSFRNFFHSWFSPYTSGYSILLNCMKPEVLMAVEMSRTAYKATQDHNPEDYNPHFYCHESLKHFNYLLCTSMCQ